MTFRITRADGKSDAEVLGKLVAAASPGDLLSYRTISEALNVGASRLYSRKDVQSAVCRSERSLAVHHQRALVNVRNRGYRIALAAEHQMIAGRKKERASTLLKRGLTVLQHVDWDAMDANQRRAHEGQLMVIGALHSAMTGLDTRLRRIEDAIKSRNGDNSG